MFQMLFAAITPLLMTGTFAARMCFRSCTLFITLWEVMVYYPVAHWVWGGGWLARYGVIDFAGGICVHTTAGASAIVIAIALGPRVSPVAAEAQVDQTPSVPPGPSNLPLALT
eukprot:SAG31_NODE_21161_length_556_cov_1.129103_1_plen_112_part_10